MKILKQLQEKIDENLSRNFIEKNPNTDLGNGPDTSG